MPLKSYPNPRSLRPFREKNKRWVPLPFLLGLPYFCHVKSQAVFLSPGFWGHTISSHTHGKLWGKRRLKAGGEGDNRGWDSWIASPTWWTWVWASSGGWWWTGKPGMLQSMGSQRVRHDWATELNLKLVSFYQMIVIWNPYVCWSSHCFPWFHSESVFVCASVVSYSTFLPGCPLPLPALISLGTSAWWPISLFLPLWAGGPGSDPVHRNKVVLHTN